MTKIWTGGSGLLLSATSTATSTATIKLKSKAGDPSYTSFWEFRGETYSNLDSFTYKKELPFTAEEYVETYYSAASSEIKNSLISELQSYIEYPQYRNVLNPSAESFFSQYSNLSLAELRERIISLDTSNPYLSRELISYAAWYEGTIFYAPFISVKSNNYWNQYYFPEAGKSISYDLLFKEVLNLTINITSTPPIVEKSLMAIRYNAQNEELFPADQEGPYRNPYIKKYIKVSDSVIQVPSNSYIRIQVDLDTFGGERQIQTINNIISDSQLDFTFKPKNTWEFVGYGTDYSFTNFSVLKSDSSGFYVYQSPCDTGSNNLIYKINTSNPGSVNALYTKVFPTNSELFMFRATYSGKKYTFEIYRTTDPKGQGNVTKIYTKTITDSVLTSNIKSIGVPSLSYCKNGNKYFIAATFRLTGTTSGTYSQAIVAFELTEGSSNITWIGNYNSVSFGASGTNSSSKASFRLIPLIENNKKYIRADISTSSSSWYYTKCMVNGVFQINSTTSLTRVLTLTNSDFYQFDYALKASSIYINGHSYFCYQKDSSTNILCFFNPNIPAFETVSNSQINIDDTSNSGEIVCNPYSDIFYWQSKAVTPFYSFTSGKAVQCFNANYGESCLKYDFGLDDSRNMAYDNNYVYILSKRTSNSEIEVYRLPKTEFFNTYFYNYNS